MRDEAKEKNRTAVNYLTSICNGIPQLSPMTQSSSATSEFLRLSKESPGISDTIEFENLHRRLCDAFRDRSLPLPNYDASRREIVISGTDTHDVSEEVTEVTRSNAMHAIHFLTGQLDHVASVAGKILTQQEMRGAIPKDIGKFGLATLFAGQLPQIPQGAKKHER